MNAPLVVIQARMSSSRLPGKALAPLGGRPALGVLIERLRRCRRISGICLATSDRADDDALAAFAQDAGIVCRRGPLDDVAGRFRLALAGTGAAFFVRINGDSPFLDPALVDRAAALAAAGECDLVTNVMPRDYPVGQSVEAAAVETFLQVESGLTDPLDREHVTRYFHREAKRFRIVSFTGGLGAEKTRLAIDTAEDLAFARRLADRLGPRLLDAGVEELLAAVGGLAPEPIFEPTFGLADARS